MGWNKCNWPGCVVLTLIVAAVVPIAKCDNSVHILFKYRQHITSSTLNWLPINHYEPSKQKNLVVGGFQVISKSDDSYNDDDSPEPKQLPMYVCRALHSGTPVAGAQLEGEKRCTVTFLGNVQSYERYELLENVENAARLSWLVWDKFHQIPTGAVATDTMYVARHVVSSDEDNKDGSTLPTYTHYIGTLDNTDKLGTITYVKDNGKDGSANFGEVLVETEPIYYELTSVKLTHWRKRIIENEPRIIGEATISNSRNERAKLAEAFGYKYKYLSYWGQGHAMIKALNTSITLYNRTKLGIINWGIEEKSFREDTYSVEIYLEPGTGVNVTVRANYTDYEVPYTGQLVSHYEDGESKSREINGIRREQTIIEIKPEFGPIYFLSNMSIVPTTPAPSTTHQTTNTVVSSTSGSTSTSSTTTRSNNRNKVISQDEPDDNLIVPPTKTDANIQGDDGGPQSLKNKEDTAYGASSTLTPSVFLALILLTLCRIT